MKLSVLMPVYNERTTLEQCVVQVLAARLPEDMERELILVDDRSTDGTWDIVQRLAASLACVRAFRHERNRGKGAAVRTAIQHASGDFAIVQDADLEYDPAEYSRLLRPLLDGRADAVFGSRYLAGEQIRALPFWHSAMNKSLTLLSNLFSNLNLTDMETCYKVFRTDLLKSVPIRSDRFGFEPEIVMKCAKRKWRIYEVPISYHGRTYEEGKKVGWKDGVKALGVILKFWLIDDLYATPYGRGVLNNVAGTPQYLSWLARLVRPHLGDAVLELGAGLGTLSGRLMARRLQYVAAETDALLLDALRNRFLRTPSVSVRRIEPAAAADYAGLEASLDTALCLNVLEYQEDPAAVIANLDAVLKPGGTLVILVPHLPSLYGTLDRAMGHKRRFTAADIRALAAARGFAVETAYGFNRAAALGWWLYSRVLRRDRLGRASLKLFDKTVWIWRRIDRLLPWKGLSLLVVARKPPLNAASSAAPAPAAETPFPPA